MQTFNKIVLTNTYIFISLDVNYAYTFIAIGLIHLTPFNRMVAILFEIQSELILYIFALLKVFLVAYYNFKFWI
jgi:hypothetical protein